MPPLLLLSPSRAKCSRRLGSVWRQHHVITRRCSAPARFQARSGRSVTARSVQHRAPRAAAPPQHAVFCSRLCRHVAAERGPTPQRTCEPTAKTTLRAAGRGQRQHRSPGSRKDGVVPLSSRHGLPHGAGSEHPVGKGRPAPLFRGRAWAGHRELLDSASQGRRDGRDGGACPDPEGRHRAPEQGLSRRRSGTRHCTPPFISLPSASRTNHAASAHGCRDGILYSRERSDPGPSCLLQLLPSS